MSEGALNGRHCDTEIEELSVKKFLKQLIQHRMSMKLGVIAVASRYRLWIVESFRCV